MKFDLTKIEKSRFDFARKLRLPTNMDEYLAEDIGIMIGDGHIGKFVRPKRAVEYPIVCSCDAVTDKDYLVNFVRPLKQKLYYLEFAVSTTGKNRREMRIKINSKGLVNFYTKLIGLPLNKKTGIGIPEFIFKRKKWLKSCLRGIVDTDFCFRVKNNGYPSIKLKTESERLVRDCKKAFRILGFETSTQTNVKEIHSTTKRAHTSNYLYLSGRAKLRKYIKKIGFRNIKNLKKIKKWAQRDSNPRPYNPVPT